MCVVSIPWSPSFVFSCILRSISAKFLIHISVLRFGFSVDVYALVLYAGMARFLKCVTEGRLLLSKQLHSVVFSVNILGLSFLKHEDAFRFF
jgi:hypothetical protein